MLTEERHLEQQDQAAIEERINAISDGYCGQAPRELSPQYLTPFYEGRSIYLNAQLNSLIQQLQGIDTQIQALSLDLHQLVPEEILVEQPF